MSSEQDKLLLDHEYDGIKELNHPLPFWWKASFVLTILFGVPYFFYYVLGSGPSLQQEFQLEMEKLSVVREQATLAAKQFDMTEYQSYIPQAETQGLAFFEENCVACHKDKGIGDIGPNLTDKYWIHGKGDPASVFKVISEGVLEKGMPVWSEIYSKDKLYQVTAYLMTLKGLNLKGKAPQGEAVDL